MVSSTDLSFGDMQTRSQGKVTVRVAEVSLVYHFMRACFIDKTITGRSTGDHGCLTAQEYKWHRLHKVPVPDSTCVPRPLYALAK